MKKNILFILVSFCSILLPGSLHAQREIQFSYDNTGNMTSRIIYIPAPQKSNENSADSCNQNIDTSIKNVDTDLTDFKKVDEFNDLIGEQGIKIYPNPTTGLLIVEIPAYIANSNDRIDIVDLQGTLKLRVLPLSSSNTLNIDSYPASTYIMIIHINGESTQWKIIKQ